MTRKQKTTANTSELHRATGLDRATVKKRLNDAGVKPVTTESRKTEYDADKALTALSRTDSRSHGYDKARTQKTTAEAARVLLKLQKERGELAPISDLRDYAFNLVKAIHTRLKRYPREAKGRIHKAKSPDEIEVIMTADIDLIFENIKRDHPIAS